METRESYHDYMGRRLREQWHEEGEMVNRILVEREIASMQEQVHGLQMRVKALCVVVDNLSYKVNLLGGNPNQLEMKL
jgi:archaellum component FlaC